MQYTSDSDAKTPWCYSEAYSVCSADYRHAYGCTVPIIRRPQALRVGQLHALRAFSDDPGLSLAGQPARRMRRASRDGEHYSDRLPSDPT